ncbi:MAG: amidohydrolase, partial [Bacteroidetes bacterium]|nr:amidohydrolase [Bacteroidota bacterium]
MKKLTSFLSVLLLLTISTFSQNSLLKKKQAVIKSVEKHQQELIHLSDQIWAFAETALLEHQSSKVLADYAEQQG